MLQLLQSQHDFAALRVEPGAVNLGAVLDGCIGAAFVVAPATGAIIAANAGGLERLSLTPDGAPARVVGGLFGITGTLPAVRRKLPIETPEGALELFCELRLLMADAGQRLILAVELSNRSSSTVELASVGGPRSDRETLAEIAKKIRSGLSDGAANDDLPPSEVPPERTAPVSTVPVKHVSAVSDAFGAVSREAKLAHELKTPLSAIVAAAEIMRDERLGRIGNERYRTYAADIHDSARHALEVIARMLTGPVASEEEEVGAQSFAEIDLNEIALSAVSALKPMAANDGHALAAELAPRLPHVIADATSVRQIALNLMTNALRHAGQGAGVTVRTSYSLNGPVSLEVVDTGRGMSAEEIKRLQVGVSDTRRTVDAKGGLGLGLPFVTRLADANGARLEIESQAGRGTRAAIVFARDRVVPV